MTSAVFEFSTDGGSTWKASDLPLTGANALAPSGSPIVVKARLTSLSGVDTVAWSTTSADDLTIEAGALPQPVQAADKSCTLTIPGTGGRSYLLQAKVNGGRNTSRPLADDPAYTRRLAVHVKTSTGIEVLAAGEFDEANRAYGWTGVVNAGLRAISASGGGGVSSIKVFGQPDITGAAVLKQGANVSLSQSGQEITIAATVPAMGGAPPAIASAGAAGATGLLSDAGHTHAGLGSIKVFSQPAILGDAVLKPGTGVTLSQTGQEITVLNAAPAPQPAGAGDASKVVAADGAGTALGLVSKLWLAGARYNSAGQAANDEFGTAPAQSTGDATNGQAFGVRAHGTLLKGGVALYSAAAALVGQVLYDGTANDRVEVAGEGKAVAIVTAADRSKMTRFEAGSWNVGLAGATAYGSGEGVLAMGGGTAPSSNPANTLILYNAPAGTGVLSCTGSMSLAVGNTVKIRATSAESALVGLISLGQTGGSFGGASGTAVFVKNATAEPTTNPVGGGVLYTFAGALKYRGSSGTVTQLAAA